MPGRPSASGRASSAASRTWACTSTCGPERVRFTTRRLGRARDRTPQAGRLHVRAGRRAVVPLDRLRRRQGPGRHPLQRRSRPTSPATSATSSRSSAAASTSSIYIWGADHHGTVARLKNAAQALGFDRDAVNVLLIAWVRFVRDGEEVSMSKRSGEFVTLDELLEEVGVDAARWYFASRRTEHGHRLRHRAGAQAVERKPGLLRPVRARAHQLDPAQGGRQRAVGERDA